MCTNPLTFIDDISIFIVAPLKLEDYISIFKRDGGAAIFRYNQLLLDCRKNYVMGMYALLEPHSKKAEFVMKGGESTEVDLRPCVKDGSIIALSIESNYSKPRVVPIVEHGNILRKNILKSPFMRLYGYVESATSSAAAKYYTDKYRVRFLYLEKEKMKQFPVRQLYDALQSLLEGDYVNCILKAQIACESKLKIFMHTYEKNEFKGYSKLLTLFEETYALSPLKFSYYSQLRELNRLRNDIIHFRADRDISLDEVLLWINVSFIFCKYIECLEYKNDNRHF